MTKSTFRNDGCHVWFYNSQLILVVVYHVEIWCIYVLAFQTNRIYILPPTKTPTSFTAQNARRAINMILPAEFWPLEKKLGRVLSVPNLVGCP